MFSFGRNAVCRLIVGASLIALPAATAWADDDSSADATGGYTNFVNQTDAVVIKVPINARGEELVRKAEMHTYAGDVVTSSNNANIKAAFEAGETVEAVPMLSKADVDQDSSTWGWFDWCGNYGYRSNYYSNYSPSYYSYGNYWNYGSPYSYNYYGNNNYNYYGYRYYYYPRYY